MKTIEERAKGYAEKAWAAIPIGDFDEDHVTFENIVTEAYIAGAKSERVELTRWHDPKEELPEDGALVLLKTTFGIGFVLAEHEETGWWRPYDDEWEISDNQVHGWREIHN